MGGVAGGVIGAAIGALLFPLLAIVGILLGVLLGVWNAVRQYRISDRVSAIISIVLISADLGFSSRSPLDSFVKSAESRSRVAATNSLASATSS